VDKLTGIIKKVLFSSSNGYCIAVLDNGEKICGTYIESDIKKLEGEEVSLTGRWTKHKKYGEQFSFETIKMMEEQLYFFLTKVVKGVGKSVAKAIVEKYDEEKFVDIIENNPNKLLKIKGIKEKKLKTIRDSWIKFRHLKELGLYLSKYNVTANLIIKIFEKFGSQENLVKKIEENPYMLTKIDGIGFIKADEIAINIGLNRKSTFRVQSAISFVLNEYCNSNGNSSISKKKLFGLLDDTLKFTDENELYTLALNSGVLSGEIKKTTQDRYAISMIYFAEKKIVEFFKSRQNQNNETIISDFDRYLEKKEKEFGFVLSDEQKEAVKLINSGQKTLALVGYAGTGKSTSSRALLELLNELYEYESIRCIALSGIASQRIADTTGYNSSTIQSLLLSYEEKEYFDFKVILLDESSMVNSMMFYQIVSKIKHDTVFIIVGDDGQLPAIGAGDVLADIIKFNLTPICKLTKIYRQNENQAIATIANDIRVGQLPTYDKKFDDFRYKNVSIENFYSQKATLSEMEFSILRDENSSKILSSILSYATKQKPKLDEYLKNKNIKEFLTYFQLITPMKGGTLGANNLNNQLQNIFNPPRGQAVSTMSQEFRLGDKVIHIKNENMQAKSMANYKDGSEEFMQKRVFNGQLGLIIKLDFDQSQCLVLYPNDDMVVYYEFDELKTLLSLSYSLTIHKTQGMEYKKVVIPMTFSHFIMHNTKLLYTAITRAKKMCVIIGEEQAFRAACKRIEDTRRQTVIQDIFA